MRRSELFLKNTSLLFMRAHRDRRSFRALLLAIGWLIWATYEVWSIFRLGLWGALFWAFAMGLAITLAGWLARSYRRSDESMLRLSAPREIDSSDASAAYRPKLVQELRRLSILVDRSGIEMMHHQGKVPPDKAGITRRRTLDLAKASGVWERYPSNEQQALLSSEGSWSRETAGAVVVRVEDVNVIRWVIGIDPILAPLEFVELDLRPVLELTTQSNRDSGTTCLDASDLRPPRNLAGQMIDRLLAEGVSRGFFQWPEGEGRTRLLSLADREEGDDLLIGSETVGRASEARIRFMLQIALRRYESLDAITHFLTGDPESEFRIDVPEQIVA